MLTFLTIGSTTTPEFARAWALYEEAFPPEERRSLSQQSELLQNSAYAFKAFYQERALAGLMGVWSLAEFTFLEHVAVEEQLRGQGIGQAMMASLKQSSPLPIILEVELPATDLAQRRIAFYQRLGFHLNTVAYQQPPYGPGKPWVPMHLMSFPVSLDQNSFFGTVQHLYTKVYQVSLS